MEGRNITHQRTKCVYMTQIKMDCWAFAYAQDAFYRLMITLMIYIHSVAECSYTWKTLQKVVAMQLWTVPWLCNGVYIVGQKGPKRKDCTHKTVECMKQVPDCNIPLHQTKCSILVWNIALCVFGMFYILFDKWSNSGYPYYEKEYKIDKMWQLSMDRKCNPNI